MAKLYNLGTVMSQATAMIGGRSDLAGSTASLLANQALNVVWEELPHALQEKLAVSSTTSGEEKITLPSDFGEVIGLSNTSSVPPRLLRAKNVYDIDSGSTALGEPTAYVLYADWLELYPSPDSAYSLQLRYRAEPSVLTGTDKESSLATRFDYAWLLKSAELFCNHLGDFEQAQQWGAQYISYMASRRNDLAKRQSAREGMSLAYRTRRYPASNLSWDQSDEP